MAGVVFQCRRGRPIAASLIAVALPASNRVVELPADLQGLGTATATRCTAELDRLRALGRIGEERRECLDVGQHVAALAVGKAGLPTRHRRARQPFIYRAEQVGVGRELPARRRANLIDRAGEIAGRRNHVARARAIAGTVVAMTAGTPLHVDGLARGGVLRKEPGVGSQEQENHAERRAITHGRPRLPTPGSQSLPTSSASIPSDHTGRARPTRSRSR